MKRCARALVMAAVCGLTALAPRAAAHSSEFLLARVTTPAPGRVQVEITADYGGNPMLTSEAEARAALLDLLAVRVGESARPLRELAPLRFEKRTQLDVDAPVPRDPGDATTEHQLLTAIWSWRTDAETVAFEVPAAVSHSVILWKGEPLGAGQSAQWAILLGGDRSPPIAVQPRTTARWLPANLGAVGLILLAGFAAWARRRQHAAVAAAA